MKRRSAPLRSAAVAFSQSMKSEILACLVLATAVYLALSQASFSFYDDSPYAVRFPSVALSNWGGRLGAVVAGWNLFNLGVIAYLLPVPLLWCAYWLAFRGALREAWVRLSGLLMLLFALMVGVARFRPEVVVDRFSVPSGGRLGQTLEHYLGLLLGRSGSVVFLVALALIGFMLWRQEGLVARARALAATRPSLPQWRQIAWLRLLPLTRRKVQPQPPTT